MTNYVQTDDFVTDMQTGNITIENGRVIGLQVAPVLANWDFIKRCNRQEIFMHPELRAGTYKGQRKIIVHDDPMEFDQEFKVFD